MKILIFMIFVISTIYANQYRNEKIQNVVKIVEKEYLDCLKKGKISNSRCELQKQKQFNQLSILDEKESAFINDKRIKEEREERSKLPPTKPSPAGEIMIENMDYCLEKAQTIEENKACMLAMHKGKFFEKQKHEPITPKNKVHIQTEEEKPDLTTLREYKDRMKQLKAAEKASSEGLNAVNGEIISSTKNVVVNKNMSNGNDKNIVKPKEVVKENVVTEIETPITKDIEPKKPKKKVRFKN